MPICTGFPQLLLLSYILTRKELEKNKRNLFELFFCKGKYYNYIHTYVYSVADSGIFKNFLYQGGVKSTVSWVFEDLKFKISEGYDPNWCFPDSAPETANWAESGKHQFWYEPSEILNLRTSTTPETVAFTPP